MHDKHRIIEEPDELKGSRPVLRRVQKVTFGLSSTRRYK